MIIEEAHGNVIFAAAKAAQDKVRHHIAHGCNAQGVMGAGFAALVKKRWPEAFLSYKELCDKRTHLVGSTHIHEHRDDATGEHVIIFNMITQLFPGRHAKTEHIKRCLEEIDQYVEILKEHGFWGDEDFIMAPRIGCGLGGLSWRDVRPLFDSCRTPFKIYTL